MKPIHSALILGGTRFVGKRLVRNLLNKDISVTIATRGLAEDSFGSEIERLIIDRSDKKSLESAFKNKSWDIAFDQICYAPSDALNICETLSGKVRRYVLTSSLAVYQPSEDISENAFIPEHYQIQYGVREDFTYNEGKRLAEAVIFQKASFSVVAVRFPIILGPDDYTQRLADQIALIANDKPVQAGDVSSKISLISSKEAADFLTWLAGNEITGAYNACSIGDISIEQILAEIEHQTHTKVHIDKQKCDDPFSLFAFKKSFTGNNTKAVEAGFKFDVLTEWLPRLISELIKGMNGS